MIYIILACIFSVIFGFILRGYLFGRQPKYVGNIVVTKKDGMTLFSLELDDNPEIIQEEKEVKFKVMIPEIESNRE